MRFLTAVTLFVFASAASAEEAKLSGIWSKKADGFTITIAFQKGDTLQFSMDDGNDGCVLDAKYTRANDGTVKCEVVKFEKKGNFPVEKEKGYLFSFKPVINGKTAAISQFEGKEIDDQAKAVLEGKYDKKD